jgi:hypothetical protein
MKENQAAHFAVCLDNEGYEASLEVSKLYRVIPDAEVATHGYIRVVDESGGLRFLGGSLSSGRVAANRGKNLVGGISALNVAPEQFGYTLAVGGLWKHATNI